MNGICAVCLYVINVFESNNLWFFLCVFIKLSLVPNTALLSALQCIGEKLPNEEAMVVKKNVC